MERDQVNLEASPQEVSALLHDALDRCRKILERKPYEEAELRGVLCWLKLALDEAQPIFIIEGTALNHPLLAEESQMVEKLLATLKTIYPTISTWERACDPKYAVANRGTRRGSQPGQAFDPVEMRKGYDANRARIHRTFEVPVHLAPPPGPPVRPAEATRQRDPEVTEPPTNTTGNLVSDSTRPGGGGAAEFRTDGPQGGESSAEDRTRRPMPRGQGPEAGDFLLESSAPEPRGHRSLGPWPARELATTDSGSETTGRHRRSRTLKSKYGHQEDDAELFSRCFGTAQDALHLLDLGDQFRYPSDKAFMKHFPVCDFQKAMKTGGLPKFDGTIRGYPGFRSNFYYMLYVQREHYLTKLLALEYMVPDKVKLTLFHGL